MQKYFNTSGPCNPNDHYMLPAQERCQDIIALIEQKQYFVIHAARQSGKTTLLLNLVEQLNQSGQYYALYCSLEVAHAMSDPAQGITAIINRLKLQVSLHPQLNSYDFAKDIVVADYATNLLQSFTFFCHTLDKPLVILFDEADCLANGTLISFLRQLRDGYINRSQIPFVHAVALVGMRNIRDYKGRIREDRDTLGSASPFNIISDHLTLRNFTLAEIIRLYAQHTAATGQTFPEAVTQLAYHYSQGQPWLSNAIAREIVQKILHFDTSQKITQDQVE